MSEDKSFIDINLDDAKELKALPEGEYEVQIMDAEVGTSDKTGGNYLLLRIECPTHPDSKDMTDVMMLPTENDREKQKLKRLDRIKKAMQAYGYDWSASGGGIDVTALVGKTAWAYLTVEEDAEYGEQNRIKKYIASK